MEFKKVSTEQSITDVTQLPMTLKWVVEWDCGRDKLMKCR